MHKDSPCVTDVGGPRCRTVQLEADVYGEKVYSAHQAMVIDVKPTLTTDVQSSDAAAGSSGNAEAAETYLAEDQASVPLGSRHDPEETPALVAMSSTELTEDERCEMAYVRWKSCEEGRRSQSLPLQ